MLNLTPKNPNFKLSNHAQVLKYKIVLLKGYKPHWCEEAFVLKTG